MGDLMIAETKCPICAGGVRPCLVIQGRPLMQCLDCRHIAWGYLPTPIEVDEHYTNIYANDHNQSEIQEAGREFYRHHANHLAVNFAKSNNLTIVDYGCAWPTFLREVQNIPNYKPLIGVDYDPKTIEYGRSLNLVMHDPISFIEAIPDKSIDIIRFSHVIEHMIDPVSELKSIFSKLKTNGIVYITQPNFPVLKTTAFPSSIKDSVYPEHLHFFNPISLSRMLNKLGTEMIEFHAFQIEDLINDLYEGQIDTAYASTSLQKIDQYKPSHATPLQSMLWFCGENIHCISRMK